METKTSSFIFKAKKVHCNKYDYSKVEYANAKTKVCIICPVHGEFWQTPNNHLRNRGCPECAKIVRGNKKRKNYVDVKNKFDEKYNGIYNYPYLEDEYKNNRTPITAICKMHGIFKVRPDNHLNGRGCPICGQTKKGLSHRLNFIDFEKKANKIHNNDYYYYNDYLIAKEKIKIKHKLCNRIFYQTPDSHLHGNGCPYCKSSHLENEIRQFLNENNLIFEEQKRFYWLGKQSLDFYLPDYNIAIECQGIQHFESVDIFGGDKVFEENKRRDKLKYKLCDKNNIKLLYYANYEYNFPYKVITNKEILSNIINKQKMNNDNLHRH